MNKLSYKRKARLMEKLAGLPKHVALELGFSSGRRATVAISKAIRSLYKPGPNPGWRLDWPQLPTDIAKKLGHRFNDLSVAAQSAIGKLSGGRIIARVDEPIRISGLLGRAKSEQGHYLAAINPSKRKRLDDQAGGEGFRNLEHKNSSFRENMVGYNNPGRPPYSTTVAGRKIEKFLGRNLPKVKGLPSKKDPSYEWYVGDSLKSYDELFRRVKKPYRTPGGSHGAGR